MVLYDPILYQDDNNKMKVNEYQLTKLTVSISNTVLKAFSDMPEIGAKKFPAAPRKIIKRILKLVISLLGVDELCYNQISLITYRR